MTESDSESRRTRDSGGGILKAVSMIDRRLIYALLFIVVLGPLYNPISIPVVVSPDTVTYLEVIMMIEPDDIIFVSLSAEFSGWNELSATALATIRVIIEKGAKMVFVSGHPEATSIPPIIYDALKTEFEMYDYVYWEDMIDLGYVFPDPSSVAAMAGDFHGLIKSDASGRSIAGTFLDEINDASDWDWVFDITTGCRTGDIINHFVISYEVPYFKDCMGGGVPASKSQMDAGIIEAYVAGLRGAAELELLLHQPGSGLAAMVAFTLAHYMLIILIVLGNIGYFGYTRKMVQRDLEAAREART